MQSLRSPNIPILKPDRYGVRKNLPLASSLLLMCLTGCNGGDGGSKNLNNLATTPSSVAAPIKHATSQKTCTTNRPCVSAEFDSPIITPTIFLPQTGQTPTLPITAMAGMDGYTHLGIPWAYVTSGSTTPATRFVAGSGVGAGCITDNLTGLVWVQNANLFGTPVTWDSALAQVEYMNTVPSATGYNLCGYTDWRLPTINELFSLVNDSQKSSAGWLNTAISSGGGGFGHVQFDYYWSSTSTTDSPTFVAMMISFSDGDSWANYKTQVNYVWPVRGG